MPGIKSYQGPFNKLELLHLLRRTMFGPSKSDLDFFEGKTLMEVLDLLIPSTPALPAPPLRTYYSNTDPSLDQMEKYNNGGSIVTAVPFGETWVNTPLQQDFLIGSSNNRRANLKYWWTGLQIHQERTLYEKMIMFYQTLLVTEDTVIENGNTSYNTQTLYRKYAFGNYKQLLKEITIDPGMLKYLNGEKNTKNAPDENYGRELQELFTLGKGLGSQFTEDDVKAASRVLTGWNVLYTENVNGKTRFIIPKTNFSQKNHDTGTKAFSSFYNNNQIIPDISITNDRERATKELNDLIDLIFKKDEVSKYICRRLWNFFVYYDITPEIEAEIIEPLAEIFRAYEDHSEQMKFVMRAMFNSSLFFDQKHRNCMIKSACDFTIGLVRQIEFPYPNSSLLEAQYYMWGIMHNANINIGFNLNSPPDVAGWPAYYQQPVYHEMWFDTTSFPFRRGMYEAYSRSNFALDKKNTYDPLNNPSYGYLVKMNFADMVKKFDNPSDPNEVINEGLQIMLAPPISNGIKAALKTNFLLNGQSKDYYWTEAWNIYTADPKTNDPSGKQVPMMLQNLFNYIMSAAEYQLC